ncbi:MAG: TIGR04255 family protein [Bacteroidota bacterium]
MPYPKSPIREAIFDIRFMDVSFNSVDDFDLIHEHIKNIFTERKEKFRASGSIDVGAPKAQLGNFQNEKVGFVYQNKSQTMHLQVYKHGLTLNVLKPYKSWEEHFPIFMQCLELFYELFTPKSVVRLGLRYINRVKIPMPLDSFQKYILNVPPIPDPLPKVFNNFFMQISTPCDEKGDMNATIIQTIEPVTDGKLPFIIDIDLFQTQVENKPSEISVVLENMRKMKNEVFESLITEETRNLFK